MARPALEPAARQLLRAMRRAGLRRRLQLLLLVALRT